MDSNSRRSFFVISLVAFALFMAVALLQHSPHDWPFDSAASIGSVGNLAGPLGSLLAWACMALVGTLFAWLAPFFLLILAGALALDRPAQPGRGVMRVVLMVLLLNTFFAILRYTSEMPQLSGWIGATAAGGLRMVFGRVGGTIVVTACLLIVSLNVIGFLGRTTSAGLKRGVLNPSILLAGAKALWKVLLGMVKTVAVMAARLFRALPRLVRRSRPGGEQTGDTAPPVEDDSPRINMPGTVIDPPVARDPEPAKPTVKRAARPASSPPASNKEPVEAAASGIPVEKATLPSLSLLDEGGVEGVDYPEDKLKAWAGVLEEKLAYYRIEGRVTGIKHGPLITTFEFAPNPGVKVKDIVSRADDITLAMKAKSLRLIAPIPGKSVVGIEIPNPEGAFVYLRNILPEIPERKRISGVMVGLGVDVMGHPFCMNVCNAPHLLIAGTTGSGKSVTLHGILASILLQYRPADVRLLIVDPKMVEMNIYNGLPHLLHPVTNDPKETVQVFQFLIEEMDRRKELLRESGVKNIESYNSKIAMTAAGSEDKKEKLPYIVLVIDELGDLVLSKGVDMESLLSKLSNMARAVGIHMVVATQRPSVDVIVGKTKANFPTRIAFRVATKVDSRTILDCVGAEKLLGRGDMLYMDANNIDPIRLHGAFISESEIERVIDHWKSYEYEPAKLEMAREKSGGGWDDTEDDPLYGEARAVVLHYRQGSTSLLQRRLHIGYARAARLLDRLEQEGIVGPPDGSKPREVLVSEESAHSLDD